MKQGNKNKDILLLTKPSFAASNFMEVQLLQILYSCNVSVFIFLDPQRQFSSPETYHSQSPPARGIHIQLSNVTGFQQGNNNTMYINECAMDCFERRRHPTAPSSVNLPPPHPGGWKNKTGGVDWVHVKLFDSKFSNFFFSYISLSLVDPFLHNRKVIFYKRSSMCEGL